MVNSVNSSRSKVPGRVTMPPVWFRVATAVLAIAIFVADTATDFEVSVSVLYVIVVLMAGRFLERRGMACVTASCVALTVISPILTPPQGGAFRGVANTLFTIAASTITTILVLQSQTRELVLKEHIKERKRAGEVIAWIRALTKRAATPCEKLDLNETIREALALIGDEAKRRGVVIRMQVAEDLTPI